MGMSGQTTPLKIPYGLSGDIPTGTDFRTQATIIQDYLLAALLAAGGTRVYSEGSYSSVCNADNSYTITLAGTPALKAVINSQYAEFNGQLKWVNLAVGGVYNLYILAGANLYADPTAITTFASQTVQSSSSYLFLATLDNRIPCAGVLDTNPPGKPKATDGTLSNINPFGTALTQQNLTVPGFLTVNLVPAGSVTVNQVSVAATVPPIVVNNNTVTQPTLKSTTNLTFADARTATAGLALTDSFYSSFYFGATSLVGGIDKALLPPVVPLTDAATILTDATLGSLFGVTLGGNRTLGNPTGGTDGQVITWRIRQDGTGSRLLTIDTAFQTTTTVPSVTLSTGAGAIDHLTARYNFANTKWYLIDYVPQTAAAGGSGSVTSVALSLPGIFTVSGSPVTTSGTLTAVLANETANFVWAGPISGSPAVPTFRALDPADIPALTAAQIPIMQAAGTGLAPRSGAVPETGGTPGSSRYLREDATWQVVGSGTGTGTVTSAALTMPAIFSVAGSPVTSSGTFAVSLATETANLVWAGPSSGGAATPTFRLLVAADIPNLDASVITTGFVAVARLPVFVAGGSHAAGIVPDPGGGGGTIKFLREDTTWAVPPGGNLGTVTSVDLSVPTDWTLANNPITTSGTILVTYTNQLANTMLAGPVSGSASTPSYRLLVTADIPNLDASKVTTGTFAALRIPVMLASGSSIIGVGTRSGAVPDPGAVTGTTKFLREDGAWVIPAGGGGSSGTVTSVAATVPTSILTVGGSPVTVSGTLAFSLATQAAATVWAGPTSGGVATPTFRALIATDIPNLPASIITSGKIAVAQLPALAGGGSHTAGLAPDPGSGGGTSRFLREDGSWIAPSGSGTVTSVALTMPSGFSVGGSPVTGAGTLAVTTSLSGILKGTGSAISAATAGTDYPGLSSSNTFSGTNIIANGILGHTVQADTDAATITFDMAVSSLHTVSLAGNRTLVVSNVLAGQTFTIILHQDGFGNRTVTWFTVVNWPGGVIPTLTTTASKSDVFTFIQIASNTYLGFVVGQNM